MRIELIPLRSRIISVGEDLIDHLKWALENADINLLTGDILVISVKAVSTSRGYLIKYDEIMPSRKAIEISSETGLEPSFVEAVLQEADSIFGYDKSAILTLKHGIMVINAGLDRKNVPQGFAAKWPDDPDKEAEIIRKSIKHKFNIDIPVLIIDSRVIPLRRGTIGFSLGFSGLKGSIDLRGKYDLFGKTLKVTWHNIVDDLAAAAHLLMGETTEMVPFVLIRGLPKKIYGDDVSRTVIMDVNNCIYMKNLIGILKIK